MGYSPPAGASSHVRQMTKQSHEVPEPALLNACSISFQHSSQTFRPCFALQDVPESCDREGTCLNHALDSHVVGFGGHAA